MTESENEREMHDKRDRAQHQRERKDDPYSRQRFVDAKLEVLRKAREGDQVDD